MSERLRTSIRWALIITGVAVLYFGSGRALIALSAPPNGAVSAVWIPSGISVAAMIIFGPFTAVGALLGSLVFELTAGTPPLGAVGLAMANAIGDLTAYFLIVGFPRHPKRPFSLETTSNVSRFLAAAVTGSIVSGTLGTVDYVLGGVLKSADFWPNWLTFFGSGVMGIVLFTPVLVYVVRDRGWLRRWARTAGFVIVLAAISLMGWLWKGQFLPDAARDSALILGVLLILISAFRFEPAKMSVAVVGFSIGAILGSAQSVTAEAGIPLYASLFALQFVSCSIATIGFFGSAIVTEQNKAHDRLRLAAKVFEISSESVVITLPDATIVDVNDTYARLHGLTREEVKGKNPRIFKSGRHGPEFYRRMWDSLLKTGEWNGEVWDRRADGGVFLKLLSISAVRDERGKTTHYVGVASDVTEIKEAENKLVRLATHDALTGLANRAMLDEELARAIARARRHGTQVAAGFLDLDHFKNVNDTFGHAQGDELLVQVARRLTSVVRESDTVGRPGGDEFIIVAPDLDGTRDLEGLARRLLEAVRKPYRLEDEEAHVSSSLGIAIFPLDGDDVETLVKHADVAMYRAKDLGRDRSQFFSGELQEEFHRRVQIENGLRKAIETEQLFVLYQPQVDLVTGRIEAVEALVRWRMPDGTVNMPDEFIPIAEESGLIIPLGEQVLRRACEDVTGLRAEGFDLKVAVNFSARQFREVDISGLLRAALTESGLAPDALEVEVTETTLMSSHEDATAQIAAIREQGVRISLDDFGTGYSSLKYVRVFSPDRLKIDRCFTQGLPDDPGACAIVLAAMAMAENLGTQVVAEGVETAEQLQFLRANGCLHVQGYLFSKPVALDELRRLLVAGPYELGAVRA